MPELNKVNAIQALLAKQNIANALATHSRGVDRADFPLLCSAYHAGATVAYGLFEGPAVDFCKFITDYQKALPGTLHRSSNMFIQLTDEHSAQSESYVIAQLETSEEGVATQRVVGGRYLDTHACKDGVWRLTHRTYVLEWNINQLATGSWSDTAGALFTPRGGKTSSDPGYTLLTTWSAAHAAKSRTENTGDRAVGESYVIAVVTVAVDGKDTDSIVGGRYVDRFERRAGVWKIAEHVFVQDWNMNQPSTAQFDDAFYGALKLRGGYKPADPIYSFWQG